MVRCDSPALPIRCIRKADETVQESVGGRRASLLEGAWKPRNPAKRDGGGGGSGDSKLHDDVIDDDASNDDISGGHGDGGGYNLGYPAVATTARTRAVVFVAS